VTVPDRHYAYLAAIVLERIETPDTIGEELFDATDSGRDVTRVPRRDTIGDAMVWRPRRPPVPAGPCGGTSGRP
jgi:hypothetical protein